MQLGVVCSDQRAFQFCVGRDHAMNQPARNMRAAIERDRYEYDGAPAPGEYQPVFAV